jgi:CxxC motif-containing protein
MNRELTCIECPQGCRLTVEIENGKALKVTGNKCPRGEAYGRQEVENPVRTFTSSVLTSGLDIKMLPVRTSGAIPKDKMLPAMDEVRGILVTEPVPEGGIIKENFLGIAGVNLIACRPAVKA